MEFVNGKQVSLPSNATVNDIVRASGKNFDPNTRAVYRVTKQGNERLTPGKSYAVKPGDKFQTGPDRVKGYGETYFGQKENWRKQVIIDQVADLSKGFFMGGKVTLDDNCNWVMFEGFKLPAAWAQANPGYETTKIMLIFPDQFPDLPTNGFYLPNYIQAPAGDAHYFTRGYSGAFGEDNASIQALAGAGWKWYCTHVAAGAWSPARIRNVGDWRQGDNLWDILTLCKQVLTNPRES